VQFSVRGKLKLADVRLDGRRRRQSETSGCYRWTDGCSTFVVVVISDLRPGTHVIDATFA